MAPRVMTLRWSRPGGLLAWWGSRAERGSPFRKSRPLGRPPVPEFTQMAHNKSQEKRNRQTLVRTARNKSLRSELKTRAKSALAAAEQGDRAAAAEALRIAQKRIDQAAAKGVLKKNTAARRKQSLIRRVRAVERGSATR